MDIFTEILGGCYRIGDERYAYSFFFGKLKKGITEKNAVGSEFKIQIESDDMFKWLISINWMY